MNANSENKTAIAVYAIAILGAFLIMGGMVWLVSRQTQPEPIDTQRAEQRRKALTEVRQSAQERLESYGYVDEAKAQVRLPIQRAMELIVQQSRDPQSARSNLLARVEKFNPPPPPPPPAAPSPFE